MKNSPLQLENLLLIKASVEAVPLADERSPWDVEAVPSVSCRGTGKDNRAWVIDLTVTVKPKTEQQPTYRVEVQVFGAFRVSNEWPEKNIESLVYANGTSLLYSAAREIVSNLTARGPYPMLVLPSVSFTDTIPKPKAQEKGAPATSK